MGGKTAKHVHSAQWTSFIQSLYFCSKNKRGTCHNIVGEGSTEATHLLLSFQCLFSVLLPWQSETRERQTVKKLRKASGSPLLLCLLQVFTFSLASVDFQITICQKMQIFAIKTWIYSLILLFLLSLWHFTRGAGIYGFGGRHITSRRQCCTDWLGSAAAASLSEGHCFVGFSSKQKS